MNDTLDLIARLEAATGPNITIDMDISRLVRKGPARTDAQGFPMDVKDYTKSIDAALRLVPDGSTWLFCNHSKYPTTTAIIYRRVDLKSGTVESESGNSTTPAIAICIAALKARAS